MYTKPQDSKQLVKDNDYHVREKRKISHDH